MHAQSNYTNTKLKAWFRQNKLQTQQKLSPNVSDVFNVI